MSLDKGQLSAFRRSATLATSLAFAAGLTLAGCPGKPAPESRAPADSGAPDARTVRVVFDLPGDDIGGPEARALLGDATAALVERQAGRILRSGFGMGEAEIVLQVEGDSGLEDVRRAIEAVHPGTRRRIVRGER